jgi:hypothetical protein
MPRPYDEDDDPDYGDGRERDEDGFYDREFADPGGDSALRAATLDDPRDQPCPTCEGEDLLTSADVSLGYQCNGCARRDEGGY